jgi:spore germination cell wall hydrolase CwlJ-like protein
MYRVCHHFGVRPVIFFGREVRALIKLKHFLSMLSFLAVAVIVAPNVEAGPNNSKAELAMIPPVSSPVQQETLQPQASLTPQQQVDNVRATVSLSETYVLNLKETDPTMYCLAQNAFFEARAESLQNKVAVTEVVKNRLDSGKYAGTLCAIVRQKTSGICQFSWVCQNLGKIPLRDSNGDIRPEIYKQWYDSVLAAYIVQKNLVDPVVPGALNFYAQRTVHPSWANRFKRIAVIGGHTFMKPRE